MCKHQKRTACYLTLLSQLMPVIAAKETGKNSKTRKTADAILYTKTRVPETSQCPWCTVHRLGVGVCSVSVNRWVAHDSTDRLHV